MKRRLSKVLWYLGLGYLTTVLGLAMTVFVADVANDSFWSNSEFARGTWYQTLGTFFVYGIGFLQVFAAPYLIVISAFIGALLFCFTVLVKKVTSAFKSGVRDP